MNKHRRFRAHEGACTCKVDFARVLFQGVVQPRLPMLAAALELPRELHLRRPHNCLDLCRVTLQQHTSSVCPVLVWQIRPYTASQQHRALEGVACLALLGNVKSRWSRVRLLSHHHIHIYLLWKNQLPQMT